MRYKLSDELEETLKKLKKKDRTTYDAIYKKIEEIVNSDNIEHYKNLSYDMQDYKEVHIRKSFVLVFKFDKNKQLIEFVDFDHHDKIFPRKT